MAKQKASKPTVSDITDSICAVSMRRGGIVWVDALSGPLREVCVETLQRVKSQNLPPYVVGVNLAAYLQENGVSVGVGTVSRWLANGKKTQ